jgi:hypothetical protein
VSAVVLCPECRRKLKAPETIGRKSFRCPGCKTIISAASLACLLEADPENESMRKGSPDRKKSSTGLIIGLAAGCTVLMLLVLGAGGGVLWYFLRTKTIPASAWQSFSPPNSGCTILMPGKPFTQSLNLMGIVAKNYQVERKQENAVFSVLIFDLPPPFHQPNILEALANSARNGSMAQIEPGSEVTNETPISLGNIPGREYQIKTPTRGMFIERIYLAKIGNTHRVYVVRTGGYYIQPNTGDAARFFDSFQLDAGATPPSFDGGAEKGKEKPLPGIHPPQRNRQAQPPGPNPGRRTPRG